MHDLSSCSSVVEPTWPKSNGMKAGFHSVAKSDPKALPSVRLLRRRLYLRSDADVEPAAQYDERWGVIQKAMFAATPSSINIPARPLVVRKTLPPPCVPLSTTSVPSPALPPPHSAPASRAAPLVSAICLTASRGWCCWWRAGWASSGSMRAPPPLCNRAAAGMGWVGGWGEGGLRHVGVDGVLVGRSSTVAAAAAAAAATASTTTTTTTPHHWHDHDCQRLWQQRHPSSVERPCRRGPRRCWRRRRCRCLPERAAEAGRVLGAYDGPSALLASLACP